MKTYLGAYHEEDVTFVTILIDADSHQNARIIFKKYLDDNDLFYTEGDDKVRLRPLDGLQKIS